MGFGTNKQRGMDGVRKNEREVHQVNCFRNRVNFFRDSVNLFQGFSQPFQEGDINKTHFQSRGVESEFCRSSLGRRSVSSRWNQAKYKRRKRDGNLNKSTFLSLVVLRSFLGSSLVRPWSLDREGLVRYKGKEY